MEILKGNETYEDMKKRIEDMPDEEFAILLRDMALQFRDGGGAHFQLMSLTLNDACARIRAYVNTVNKLTTTADNLRESLGRIIDMINDPRR